MNIKSSIRLLLSASIVSQGISFFSVYLISIIYMSEDIGFYGYIVSSIAIGSIILSFRYENLIYRVELDKSYGFSIFLVFLSLSFLLVILLILSVFNLEVIKWQYFILFGSYGYCIFNIAVNLSVRLSKTPKELAQGKLLRSGFELSITLILILFGFDINYIIGSLIFSYFSASLFLFIKLSGLKINFNLKYFFHENYSIAFKNFKFIRMDFPASVINAVVINSPVVFLYSSDAMSEYTAIYFLLSRFLGAPLILVAQSIGLALKQDVQKRLDINESSVLSSDFVHKKIPYFILFLSVFSVAVSVVIFNTIELNINYYDYIYICFFIAPMFLMRFAFNCFSGLIYVYGWYAFNLLFNLLSLVMVLISFFLLPNPYSIYLYCISMTIIYLFSYFYINLNLRRFS